MKLLPKYGLNDRQVEDLEEYNDVFMLETHLGFDVENNKLSFSRQEIETNIYNSDHDAGVMEDMLENLKNYIKHGYITLR